MAKLITIIPDRHADFLFEARQLPSVARFMYNQDGIEWEDHVKWLNGLSQDATRQDWVVEHHGEMVGRAYLTDIDDANRRAEFGMYISSEKARIQGVGSAAEYLALQHAFGVLELVKVSCEVFSVNEAPIRMHKRMGFVQEGVFRKHALFEGDYIDVVKLSILAEEWQETEPMLAQALQKMLQSEKI